MSLIICFLCLLVLCLWLRIKFLQADLELEREICDEDVEFYASAYAELKRRKS